MDLGLTFPYFHEHTFPAGCFIKSKTHLPGKGVAPSGALALASQQGSVPGKNPVGLIGAGQPNPISAAPLTCSLRVLSQ